MEQRPSASWIICQEAIPRQRMSEVGDEHPCSRETKAGKEGNSQHETPALTQRATKWPSTQEPNASPKREHEGIVFDAAWHPLCPELLVALAACTLIWKVTPPFHGKQGTSIVQTQEVNDWDPWYSQHEAVPLVRPLLKCIVELFWIPTELTLLKQINSAGMVPVVF